MGMRGQKTILKSIVNITGGILNNDVNILMGELKAKIGMDNRGFKDCGKTGTGRARLLDNSEKFKDVCANSYVMKENVFSFRRCRQHHGYLQTKQERSETFTCIMYPKEIHVYIILQRVNGRCESLQVVDVGSEHNLVIT